MFSNKYCFLLLLCFVLSSCKEDLPTTFSDISFNSDKNNVVSIYIPKALGKETLVSKINSEIEKMIISSLNISDTNTILPKTIDESSTLFNNEFESFKKDFPESNQLWEAQIDGDVMFQSPEIISIAISSYINTGGAHGNLTIEILNFNAETGETISNKDLFKNINDLQAIAKPYFKDVITKNEFLSKQTPFSLPNTMGYSQEGIIMLYNTSEIGPHNAGILEFTIPFEKVKSNLVFNSF